LVSTKQSPFFTCNAIKSEVDGALGAFGAWLLKPYNDKPGFTGQNTTDIYEVRKIAGLAIDNDMQFCVHAIGDRANKVVLDIYEAGFCIRKESPLEIGTRPAPGSFRHTGPSWAS
jgi:hypothetical protein